MRCSKKTGNYHCGKDDQIAMIIDQGISEDSRED